LLIYHKAISPNFPERALSLSVACDLTALLFCGANVNPDIVDPPPFVGRRVVEAHSPSEADVLAGQ
jgi:hypothetical protein